MATNIRYVLIHKSMLFETFLKDLLMASKEYQKQLKKVRILRVKLRLHILLALKMLAKGLSKVHNHTKLVSPFEYSLELENGVVCQNSKK